MLDSYQLGSKEGVFSLAAFILKMNLTPDEYVCIALMKNRGDIQNTSRDITPAHD